MIQKKKTKKEKNIYNCHYQNSQKSDNHLAEAKIKEV